MKKVAKTDGFGVAEKKAIRSAIRLVWQRSRARKLALERATDADGFFRCEPCGTRVPKVHVDHRECVGEVEAPGYIERMFTPSVNLEVQCVECHRAKTRAERQAKKDSVRTSPARSRRAAALPQPTALPA
jgi:hypothetical protein